MRIPSLLALACLVLLAPAARAQESRAGEISLGLIGGFPDVVGGELGWRMGDSFGLRAGASGLHLQDVKINEEFVGSLSTISGFGFADFYPWQGGFRLSAGLHAGEMKLKVRDRLSEDGTIANGSARTDDLRPTLSLGYMGSGLWQISADAGATYIGKPRVSANLLGETAFVGDLKAYQVMPFVRLGLSYRF